MPVPHEATTSPSEQLPAAVEDTVGARAEGVVLAVQPPDTVGAAGTATAGELEHSEPVEGAGAGREIGARAAREALIISYTSLVLNSLAVVIGLVGARRGRVQPPAAAAATCHRKQRIVVIRNQPHGAGFGLGGANSAVPE